MLSLRVDDFPFVKPEESWKHNLDTFKMFHEIVRCHVPEYHLGVIPKNVTKQQLEWLASQKGIIVAMHGIEHNESRQNEFLDHMTEKDVTDAIASAKCVMDPIVGPIDSYIPPHNCVYMRTVNALVKNGFKTLFVGPGADEQMKLIASRSLRVVDSPSPYLTGRSDEFMEDGRKDVLRSMRQDDVEHCLCLHFTWEVNVGLMQNLSPFMDRVF